MIDISVISYDKDADEADIQISAGNISILCYVQPVKDLKAVCADKDPVLCAFMARDIVLDENPDPIALKTNEAYYAYRLRGVVVSEKQIKVGELLIGIDSVIPRDIMPGQSVVMSCSRIDLIT